MFVLGIALSIVAIWCNTQGYKNTEKTFKISAAAAWIGHIISGMLLKGYLGDSPIFFVMACLFCLFALLSESLFVNDLFELGLAGYLVAYVFLSIGFYNFNFDLGLFISAIPFVVIAGYSLLKRVEITTPVVLYLIVLSGAFMFAVATLNLLFIGALIAQYICDYRLGLEEFGKEKLEHNEWLVMTCQYATFLFLGL